MKTFISKLFLSIIISLGSSATLIAQVKAFEKIFGGDEMIIGIRLQQLKMAGIFSPDKLSVFKTQVIHT